MTAEGSQVCERTYRPSRCGLLRPMSNTARPGDQVTFYAAAPAAPTATPPGPGFNPPCSIQAVVRRCWLHVPGPGFRSPSHERNRYRVNGTWDPVDLFDGSVLALVFAYVALSQIKARNEAGRGMAIAVSFWAGLAWACSSSSSFWV